MGRVAIVTDSACDLTGEGGGRSGIRSSRSSSSSARDLLGRAGPDDRRVLEADDRARTRRSRPPRRAARGLPTVTRRRSTPAPTPSSRSTSPARSPGRSRPPRSRAHPRPTARSTSSTRSRPRWAKGCSRELAVQIAAEGVSATQIADAVDPPTDDIPIFLALDTLEYLKRGGRISGARGGDRHDAQSSRSSRVGDGHRGERERVRTRGKARERMIELLTAAPIERLAVLHTTNAGIEEFTDAFMAKAGSTVAGHRSTWWARRSDRISVPAASAAWRCTPRASVPA